MSYEFLIWVDAPVSLTVTVAAFVFAGRSRIGVLSMTQRVVLVGLAVLGALAIVGTIPAPPLLHLRGLAAADVAPLLLTVLLAGVCAASVVSDRPQDLSPVALALANLRRRSAWAIGPRREIVVWTISSSVLVGVIAVCGVVSVTEGGASMLVTDLGAIRVSTAFPGWATSWPVIVAAVLSWVVGWGLLEWNARRTSRSAPFEIRRTTARIILIVATSGAAWSLASVLGQIARAGTQTTVSADGLIAPSPLAALGTVLFVIASILRGCVIGVVARAALTPRYAQATRHVHA